MDPPTMISDGAFSTANGTPYNLAEIWQFPMGVAGNSDGGVAGESAAVLQGIRRPPFGRSVGQFANAAVPNHGVSADDPRSLGGCSDDGGGCTRKRREAEDESEKGVSNNNGNANGASDGDGKRLKTTPCKEENNNSKGEAEPSSGKPVELKTQPPEPPKDYIHVRARRGQATDSHSLAERARREKISERMRILQDLVPGCNKVIGKALVLDEIINYIQSLQRQVEFLSMKLEAVNSRITPGFEVFPPKDFGQQTFDNNVMAFSSQAPREYSRGSSPEWLHMQVGGGFERTT